MFTVTVVFHNGSQEIFKAENFQYQPDALVVGTIVVPSQNIKFFNAVKDEEAT